MRFLFLLLLAGCVPVSMPAEQGIVQIYFCPENCQELFENMKHDYCAVYDYKFITFDHLITEDKKQGLMHHKFCFNKTHVLTGSYNPTKNTNDNNLLLIKSETLVNNYKSEFEYLLGKEGTSVEKFLLNGGLWENYFCPRQNCQEKVLNILQHANKSISFMAFSFTDEKIKDLLVERSKYIDVKGVLERKRINMEYNLGREMNKSFPIKLDTNPRTMHHKVFIVDNEIVITGSYNPTKAAYTINNENILIIHDSEIAQLYSQEFGRLFFEK